MGNSLSPEFRNLLEERKLMRIRKDRKLILKEISAAKSDMKDAKESIERKKFKWATIKAIIQCFTAQEHCFLKRAIVKRAIMRYWSR